MCSTESRRRRHSFQDSSSTPSSFAASTTMRLVDLIEFGRRHGAEVRFIEYMDVGGATHWSHAARGIAPRDPRRAWRPTTVPITPVVEESSAPADRYTLPDGTTFGIISSTTEPFCESCDRSRLTADGLWYLCLYAAHGTDLRRPLQGRRQRRTSRAVDSGDLGSAQRSRRGRAPRLARPVAAHPGRPPAARPASGDAHAGGINRSTPKLQLPTSKGSCWDLEIGSWELTSVYAVVVWQCSSNACVSICAIERASRVSICRRSSM